jgi:hypothetical protein
MNRDRSYLLDIHQYGQDVLEFVAGMSEADFIADLKTQRAVVYCIAVIRKLGLKPRPDFDKLSPSLGRLFLLSNVLL